jgi:ubiquinone/menaquinone biosynthesis C-methylase UbiE
MSDSLDVPTPIDFLRSDHAVEWERTAMELRPWRIQFFDAFAAQIQAATPPARVLELGSGPGFLADHLLTRVPDVDLVLLDFSAAMHELARQRLGALASRVAFVERSFKDPGWPAGLGRFDFVVTNQAVHELRHKHYAQALHERVRRVLAPGGAYLVCDHYVGDDGMTDRALYMTIDEQREAFLAAGFTEVTEVARIRGMILHRAARP